jgi:hypothetical protein
MFSPESQEITRCFPIIAGDRPLFSDNRRRSPGVFRQSQEITRCSPIIAGDHPMFSTNRQETIGFQPPIAPGQSNFSRHQEDR